jgi:hypothetical protein
MSSTKQMERLSEHRTTGIVDANTKIDTGRKVIRQELANPKNQQSLPNFAILKLKTERLAQ